jgi:hypothetical protein
LEYTAPNGALPSEFIGITARLDADLDDTFIATAGHGHDAVVYKNGAGIVVTFPLGSAYGNERFTDRLIDRAIEVLPKVPREAWRQTRHDLSLDVHGQILVNYGDDLDPLDIDVLDWLDEEDLAAEEAKRAEWAADRGSGSGGIDVNDPQSPLYGAPPCFPKVFEDGAIDVYRNNMHFNLSVYAQKRYGDGWQKRVDLFNGPPWFATPLPAREANDTKDSVRNNARGGRSGYSYKCKDNPICGHCDKATCMTRPFGIGGGRKNAVEWDPSVFGPFTNIRCSPPMWLTEVNGYPVRLEARDLTNPTSFVAKVAVSNVILDDMPKRRFKQFIRERLATVTVMEPPYAMTFGGMIANLLTDFLTVKTPAKDMDGLLNGQPFIEDGRTHFMPGDFINHLRSQRMPFQMSDLAFELMKMGVTADTRNLKGAVRETWSTPTPSKQTEAFAIPVMEQEIPF